MSEWVTLHYAGKEVIVDVNSVLAFYEVEDGTLILLSGSQLVVDEDITEVNAEMFI